MVIARSVSDAAIQAPLDCFATLAMTAKVTPPRREHRGSYAG